MPRAPPTAHAAWRHLQSSYRKVYKETLACVTSSLGSQLGRPRCSGCRALSRRGHLNFPGGRWMVLTVAVAQCGQTRCSLAVPLRRSVSSASQWDPVRNWARTRRWSPEGEVLCPGVWPAREATPCTARRWWDRQTLMGVATVLRSRFYLGHYDTSSLESSKPGLLPWPTLCMRSRSGCFCNYGARSALAVGPA